MKLLSTILLITTLFMTGTYNFNTTPAVVIAGGIIKSKYSISIDKKYPRKDCPVCKGKGWYMSGDDIKKIDCTYCEPDVKANCSADKCKTVIIKK